MQALKKLQAGGSFDEDIIIESGSSKKKSKKRSSSLDVGQIMVSDVYRVRSDDPAVKHFQEPLEVGVVEISETKDGRPVVDVIEGETTVNRLKNILSMLNGERGRKK